MQYIYGTQNIKLLEKSVVILGNFDGLHLGHQMLFKAAKNLAKMHNLKTVVFSFYPHPTWVLGDNPKSLLMSRLEKKAKLEELGIDIYVEYPFTLELAQISALDFIMNILLQKLNSKAVVIGENYFFGKNKEGNAKYMQKLSREYDFDVVVVNEVKKEDTTISSTFIRELVLSGQLEKAADLLGYPYTLRGTVVGGKRLGRTLGFPTINIIPDIVKVLPPNGVYITKLYLLGEKYYGLTNIGYNPTVNGKAKIVETYIFNFIKEVYGEEVTIEIIQYVRPEIKFNSIDELKEQLNKDKQFAKEYLKL